MPKVVGLDSLIRIAPALIKLADRVLDRYSVDRSIAKGEHELRRLVGQLLPLLAFPPASSSAAQIGAGGMGNHHIPRPVVSRCKRVPENVGRRAVRCRF